MTYEELIPAAQEYGVSISPELQEKLKTYAKLLKEWNEKMNLTAIVEEPEVIEKHFLDSLTCAAVYDFSGKSVADIGSGAGFPGIIIALAFPTSNVTLIDATKKKFLFLEEVKKTLQIENLTFHIGRVEDMKAERESFDCVTSRGFAQMNVFLEVATPLVKMNGTVLAMKGPRGEEELFASLNAEKKLSLHLRKKKTIVLPGGETRMNFTFEKTGRTPPRFPRPWAEIVKKLL